MDAVTVGNDSRFATTRLGFGTAGLLREPSKRRRLDALAAALDSGIRHFDTAPIYGLGEAERLLGEFLVGRRERVTIATKFGLAPKPALSTLGALQSTARRVLRASPALRRIARRTAATTLYQPPRFDAAGARTSLERSLAALRRDHVDALLLHECSPGALQDPALLSVLEDLRTRGRITAFGTATTFAHTLAMLTSHADYCRIAQFDSDAINENVRRLPRTVAGVIAHGALTPSLGLVVRALQSDPALRTRWSTALDADVRDAAVVSKLLLQTALGANPRGVVLVHSNDPRHILANVEAAGAEVDREQLQRFSVLMQARFGRARTEPQTPLRQSGQPS
jgi:aryl-alcohol dehydrogenase-like predicted oxidoreductase